jgi:predicted nucleic acid-binding protein
VIYLDSSALVTLVSGRLYSGELAKFLLTWPAMPMATSTVGFVETVRTLDQVGSYPTVMGDLTRRFAEIVLTEEIRDGAALLPRGLRSLDAIHIASAQAIGNVLEVLVTYDKRMLEAARAVGLRAEAPGLT